MQVFSGICKVLTWIALVFVTGLQLLVMFGIASGGSDFSIVPLVVATVLLPVAVILFFALPKGKGIPLLLAIAAGVIFIVAAVLISKEFLLATGELDSGRGITAWQFVYRHLSPVLVPLLMIVPWAEYRIQRKIDKEYKKQQEPSGYLGLEDFQLSRLGEDEEPVPAKAKKKK